ncbi:copper amine oxidase 1, partial [Striga asiatica]
SLSCEFSIPEPSEPISCNNNRKQHITKPHMTLFLVFLTNLTSLGMAFPRSPVVGISGSKKPSLNKVSMAVKCGNPRLLSMMEVLTDGTSTRSTEDRVLAENVSCFTSEKASMVGAAEDGACQVIIGVGISEIVVDIVVVNPVGGLALALAVAS